MRCFRLTHAGVVIEREGAALFIDPGNMSSEDELHAACEAAAPPAAIVITHEHADHWTPEHVRMIRSISPAAPIFTTAETAKALSAAGIEQDVVAVVEGDSHQAGPFELYFYGKRHEQIHSSVPVVENVGVRVNEVFAWGGGSLMRPPFVADVLGVPVGSPWSNIGQVMNFVLDARPRRAFLTHDHMLSPAGASMYRSRVEWCLDQVGGSLIDLPRLDEDATARLEL